MVQQIDSGFSSRVDFSKQNFKDHISGFFNSHGTDGMFETSDIENTGSVLLFLAAIVDHF